jgi:uncharacterized protein
MKVDISEVIGINGASMELDIKEGPIQKEPVEGCVLDDDITFAGSLTNDAGILHLDGRLLATYDCKCYRCLRSMKGNLDIEIREDFINNDDAAQMDMYFYEGKMLDIGKAIEDNIVLNLPMKHLCSVQCKGLCSRCGANLNTEQCNCEDEDIDPRLEGLGKLLKDL